MSEVKGILRAIRKATEVAAKTKRKPEAKLRELVSPIWEEYLKAQGLKPTQIVEQERTLLYGQADTVFKRLILEYKKPGGIKDINERNRQLIAQLKGYIDDLAKEEGWDKRRLLGVAFDGSRFVFMRYTPGWTVQKPVAVTEKSLAQFLTSLARLVGTKALTSENLIKDFAVGREYRNEVAADCVRAFYREIKAHGGEEGTKEHVFFEQWKIQYAKVHGSLEEKKIDQETLIRSYGFTKKEQKDFDVYAFFFSLDCYYAVLMKLLSYQVVGYYTLKGFTGMPLREWEEEDSDGLQRRMQDLEDGGMFRNLGIRNYLEGDLFSWYTEAWNDGVYNALIQIIRALNEYDPKTMEVAPDETRDILKKLYQYLVPKKIRHDLGEYSTPDWLAERCLNQLNYNGDPKYRILDPGCGSGTFPILAIKRAKEYARKKHISPSVTLKNILKNIYGFDLNPLAVISSRTNYLLAISDLLKYKRGEITIPIYLCDSICLPAVEKQADAFGGGISEVRISTVVGDFVFPEELLARKPHIQKTTELFEDSIEQGLSADRMLKRVYSETGVEPVDRKIFEKVLTATYKKLMRLEKKGINGIWARIIKNAFAPLFVGRFDMVAGNPPWVNWESLPGEYRKVLLPINHDVYKLFLHKGLAARHGASKIDLSTLMLYVSVDKYLKKDGKLCFVITQTLFKTVGGAKGFRQFFIHPSKTPFKVEFVDDMVELKPFEGATNRTSVIILQKGEKTKYPVPYTLWRKREKGKIQMDLQLKQVMEITKRHSLYAKPADDTDEFSNWITARRKVLRTMEKLAGCSHYTAHKGVDCSANGVYWIDIIEKKGNLVVFNNVTKGVKRKIPNVTGKIESDLIFPLLRGRDTKKWNSSSVINIIVPQDLQKRHNGMAEQLLKRNYPLTLEYLNNFRNELSSRATYKKFLKPNNLPFYSLYDIKGYTFSNYKVVWKEISKVVESSVITKTNSKVIVPDHKLVFVNFDNKSESHYFCSLINSSPFEFFVLSSSVSTQLPPKVLKEILIPQFELSNPIHLELSHLSQHCHEKVTADIDVTDLEEQINELAAEIWGLTKVELKDIQDSLEELR